MRQVTPAKFLADILSGFVLVAALAVIWIGVGLLVNSERGVDSLYIAEAEQ